MAATHVDSVRHLEAEFAEAMTRMYAVGNGLAALRQRLLIEQGAVAAPTPVAAPRGEAATGVPDIPVFTRGTVSASAGFGGGAASSTDERSAAAAFILLVHLNYTGVLGEPPAIEDPRARALALHLSRSDAKMYGASWCPHCQEQKAMFGLAASRLPYVECSPGGQGQPQAAICRNLNITVYPTWIINGKRTEEVLSMQQLAEATGFREDAQDAPKAP